MVEIFDVFKSMFTTLSNYFVILFGSVGFLEIVVIIPIVACVYRLILAPLFGFKFGLGSDKAKANSEKMKGYMNDRK